MNDTKTARRSRPFAVHSARVPGMLAAALTASALVALGASTSSAQESYFAGKTIELLSGFSEGAVSGQVLQELGRTVERLYPGTRVVYRSNPGGSSALTETMILEADPDGLTLGTVNNDSLIAKVMGEQSFDITDFDIVVSVATSSRVLYANKQSGIRSVDDLVNRPAPAFLPVRSTSSGMYYTTLLTNAALGTRIKPVTGYGSSERELAFMNGEVQLAMLAPTAGARSLEDGSAVALISLIDSELPTYFGEPPRLSAMAVNSEFGWVVDFFNLMAGSSTLAVPKGVPPDRLEALRAMFYAAAVDPDFVAQVGDKLLLEQVRGEDLQRTFEQMLSGMTSFTDDLARAMDCGMHIADTGSACEN
jgi:tripartite-type tricarboxylate transporter receptor subunit TctC